MLTHTRKTSLESHFNSCTAWTVNQYGVSFFWGFVSHSRFVFFSVITFAFLSLSILLIYFTCFLCPILLFLSHFTNILLYHFVLKFYFVFSDDDLHTCSFRPRKDRKMIYLVVQELFFTCNFSAPLSVLFLNAFFSSSHATLSLSLLSSF